MFLTGKAHSSNGRENPSWTRVGDGFFVVFIFIGIVKGLDLFTKIWYNNVAQQNLIFSETLLSRDNCPLFKKGMLYLFCAFHCLNLVKTQIPT